jgi:hypothetical protein
MAHPNHPTPVNHMNAANNMARACALLDFTDRLITAQTSPKPS